MDAEVEAMLEALRAELEALRMSLGAEIRTQRVVVHDEDGIERVILSARHQTGSVMVRVDGTPDHTTGAELVAAEDPDGGEPVLGLVVMREGEVADE